MGEEEDSQAEADDLSGGQEARCGGAAGKVGEGEEGGVGTGPIRPRREPEYVVMNCAYHWGMSRVYLVPVDRGMANALFREEPEDDEEDDDVFGMKRLFLVSVTVRSRGFRKSSRFLCRRTELDHSSPSLGRKPLHTLRELGRYVKLSDFCHKSVLLVVCSPAKRSPAEQIQCPCHSHPH